MRCKLCGDGFGGAIINKDAYYKHDRDKLIKSKYCQTCVKIKGKTHASTFIKHAKKVAAWQVELPAYLESLNKPFPCAKCGEEHMTRPGGPSICKDCKILIKEEKRIAQEERDRLNEIARANGAIIRAREAAKAAKLAIAKAEEMARLEPLLMQIKQIISEDPDWTFFIDKKNVRDHAFYKDHVKISSNMKNVWLLENSSAYVNYGFRNTRVYNRTDMLKIKELLPVKAQRILENEVFSNT